MFIDADMVFGPHYLTRVMQQAQKHAGEHRVLATGRSSMSFDDGYKVVDQADYKAPIHEAYNTILKSTKTWPAAGGRASGAGFGQLVNIANQKAFAASQNRPFAYVPETYGRDNDGLSNRPYLTRSDRAYRMWYGGVVALPNNLDFIHLNHYRKGDPQWSPELQH